MKKYIGIILFAVFGLQSCANRDGKIIEILQALQRQNEGLKVQISTLQNSANSALATLNNVYFCIKISYFNEITNKQ
jgi:UDP-glucose 6-dehydrogenase